MPPESYIRLVDSQVPVLITFYEGEIDRLAKEVADMESKLRALQEQHIDARATLATLKGERDSFIDRKSIIEENIVTHRITPYDKNMSWWDKIKWSLRKKQMVLTKNEILECIFGMEPGLNASSKDILRKVNTNIFSTLTNKFKDNELYRVKSGSEYQYGFRNWFTDGGEHVLPKFRNNEARRWEEENMIIDNDINDD